MKNRIIMIENIKTLFRFNHWAESKLPFVFWISSCSFYLNFIPDINYIIYFFLYFFSYLAFGYTFNDFCDVKNDLLAKKNPELNKYKKHFRPLPSTISLLVCLFTIYALRKHLPLVAIMVVSIIVAILYSVPLIKMKNRGTIGLIWGGVAQWVLPNLIIPFFFKSWAMTWSFILLSVFIGVRWMLIHQKIDRSNDLFTNSKTLATQITTKEIFYLIKKIVLLEYTSILIICFTFFIKSYKMFSLIIFFMLLLSIFHDFIHKKKEQDQNYQNISLSFFYFILAPIASYVYFSFTNPYFLIFILIHILFTYKFVFGKIQSLYYSIIQ